MFIRNIKNGIFIVFSFFLFLGSSGFCNEEVEKYFLPQDHWVQTRLDKIFISKDVLENPKFFKAAGFITLHNQESGMRVARHPLLPGYLLKVYLHANEKNKEEQWVEDFARGLGNVQGFTWKERLYTDKQDRGLQWAVDRCRGAENIRDLIEKEDLRYFVVPDKWIYLVSSDPVIAVLVVQDMELVSNEETKEAWRNITKRQAKELYTILSHGFGSCYLEGNVPYTKNGKFACVDTAYPYRKHPYDRVKRYFSPEMKKYWDKIVKSGENK